MFISFDKENITTWRCAIITLNIIRTSLENNLEPRIDSIILKRPGRMIYKILYLKYINTYASSLNLPTTTHRLFISTKMVFESRRAFSYACSFFLVKHYFFSFPLLLVYANSTYLNFRMFLQITLKDISIC